MTKVESKKRREKGLGSIIDRGGKYEGTFVLHRENGSRLEKSFTRRTRNEIIDIQSQLRNLGILEDNVKDVHIDRNTNKITLIRSGQNKSSIGLEKDIIVNDYMTHYLYDIRKKGINGRVIEDTTFSSYIERAKYIKDYIGNKKVREVTLEDVEYMINDLNKKIADSTVVQVRQLIVNMMSCAKKEGITSENVLEGEKLNIKEKKGKKEKKIIEQKDIDTFVNYCKEHKYYILIFLLSTGTRASEAAGVTWNNINFDDMTVEIEKEYIRVKEHKLVNGKEVIEKKKVWKDLKSSSSYRILGLDEKLVELLKEHKESQKELAKKKGKEFKETDWVFTTKSYKGYVADYTTDILKRALKETKIKNYEELCVHCLRHTFCSIGIMNGIKAEEMMKILGHSSIDVTLEIYNHFEKGYIADVSRKVVNGIL